MVVWLLASPVFKFILLAPPVSNHFSWCTLHLAWKVVAIGLSSVATVYIGSGY